MRARSIKPGICDNEVLGTADPFCTLLFERLWLMADREGRLEDRPLRIKAQAFPYRDGLNVEPLLSWLSEHGFIQRYTVAGSAYIQVSKFSQHQTPHIKEAASKIPAPDSPGAGTSPAPCSTPPIPAPAALTPSSLTPDSGLLTPDSSSLRSLGEVRAARAPPARRLPDDFALTDERRAIARTERADPDREFAKFTDHWRAASGANARKHDWDAAWRNWCRKAQDMRPNGRGPPSDEPKLTWRPPPDEDEANAGR